MILGSLGVHHNKPVGIYQEWVNKRQNCLAHYIRKARQLPESTDDQISGFGEQTLTLLQPLCLFAKAPPSPCKWENFYFNPVLVDLVSAYLNEQEADLVWQGCGSACILGRFRSNLIFIEAGLIPTFV